MGIFFIKNCVSFWLRSMRSEQIYRRCRMKFTELMLYFLGLVALGFIIGGVVVGVLALHDANFALLLSSGAAIIGAGILWTLTKIAIWYAPVAHTETPEASVKLAAGK